MNRSQTGVNQWLKMFFGIFMVVVYLGMAVLMVVNFFDWSTTALWNGVRWFFAILFAAYGIYRGYREYRGEHTYGMRIDDDTDSAKSYGTYNKPINEDKGDEKKV